MNAQEVDKDFIEIIQKRNELAELNYSDQEYDDKEEELHDLEDDFLEKYGDEFDEILADIHDELCPDTDVMLPIAYFAKQYKDTGKQENGKPVYTIGANDGVLVEVDEYPGTNSRLVFLPNPMRLVLNIQGEKSEIVWSATEGSKINQ